MSVLISHLSHTSCDVRVKSQTLNRSTFRAAVMSVWKHVTYLFLVIFFIYLNICIFFSVDLFEMLHIGPLQKVMQEVFAQKKDLVGSCVYCTIQLSFVYILSSVSLNYERSWSVFVKTFIYSVCSKCLLSWRVCSEWVPHWRVLYSVDKSISFSRIHTLDTKTSHKGKCVASVSGLRLTESVQWLWHNTDIDHLTAKHLADEDLQGHLHQYLFSSELVRIREWVTFVWVWRVFGGPSDCSSFPGRSC